MIVDAETRQAVQTAYDKAVKFDSFFEVEQASEVTKNLLTFDDDMQVRFGLAKAEELEAVILDIRNTRPTATGTTD